MEFPIIIRDGIAVDFPNEDLDVKAFWDAKRDAVLKNRKPRGKLERLLEVELFALPEGGSYQIEYSEWLRVSGGIKNPYKYIKDRYGSAIVVTRNDQGLVVFQKPENEDLFHDYNDDIITDEFNERYKGAPVEVEIGDYWFIFGPKGHIQKVKVFSFDKETMRSEVEDQGLNKRRFITIPVAEEGFFLYGEKLTIRGSGAYPYSTHYDRRWFAQEYRNCMYFRHFQIYNIFKSVENISNPQVLSDILKLTDEYVSAVTQIKREMRARIMAIHRKRIEDKKQRAEQKWLK